MTSMLRTADHLTIMFDDGETATVYPSDSQYDNIVRAAREKRWDDARELAFPSKRLERNIAASVGPTPRVVVDSGVVYLDGQPMHNTLTQRMVTMSEEGFDIQPISRFLQNLHDNPSYAAVEELYDFLEASDLPITEDGCFVAYKRVRGDYMDIYTGQIDNSIGEVPTMKRNEVDDNRQRDCSRGLHFCSRDYLPSYGTSPGRRTMIIKINPADVVSIPVYYNNAKGRCCRYEVIGELQHGEEETLEGAFYSTNPFDPEPVEYPKTMDEIVAEYEPNVVAVKPGTVRRVAQIDPSSGNIEDTFDSYKDAEALTGVDSSSISKVCRGERKHAGGWKWSWVTVDVTNTDNEIFDLYDLLDEELGDGPYLLGDEYWV